ncbi:MAG: PadR family transcriptional regulator [Kineosporiaceae bacterium]|nr:PadR family transcriptional regulator [Kineosporiaceae bacterium]MBK7625341.1 PadR family transcriptional regulator [Kineosporiaceae bacterium]MBK8076298.1 PadR family transcriptional regulator [Kineosporiaceae bacterium]
MALGEVMLALLDGGPRHGYDLKRHHDEWFLDARPLAYAQVYATLGRLERDGLVAVAHVETGGGPERTIYELTGAGRDRMTDWLAEPVDAPPPAAEEMIRKLIAAIRTDRDPAGLVARQREVLLRRLRTLTEQAVATSASASAAHPATTLIREHAITHLDADLRWLEAAGHLLAHAPHRERTDDLS